MTDADFHGSTVPGEAVKSCAGEPTPDVGAILRRMDVCRTLDEAELRQHVHDCALLLQRAYARFEAHGNPADRDEALQWWHEERDAVHQLHLLERAAAERGLDDGGDYFRSEHAMKLGGAAT